MISKSEIAAPAVHVDKWKRWDFLERCRNTVRAPPQGCGAAMIDGKVFFEELSSGRLYDLPPLSIDAQAWYEEHKADLIGGENYMRRRQQQARPRSAPPWAYAGAIYYWNQTYANPTRITYMASFCGVSQIALANNVSLCIWPGLQPSVSSQPFFVLQPVMIRVKGEPISHWHLWDVWNIAGVGQLASTPLPTSAPLLIQPQGIWSVIREYSTPSRWLIQSFRGNKGNTGPALGRPASLGLSVSFSGVGSTDGVVVGRSGVDISRSRLQSAFCEVEVPVPADGSYSCPDLGIQATFGGVTLQQGGDVLPVNWPPGFPAGQANGVTCVPNPGISNGSNNKTTQLTVAIAPS